MTQIFVLTQLIPDVIINKARAESFDDKYKIYYSNALSPQFHNFKNIPVPNNYI